MNRKFALIIALQTLVIILLFWGLVYYGKDEYEALNGSRDDDIPSTSHVDTQNGAAIITLSPQSQQQSGIATTLMQTTSQQGSVSSFGQIVPIDGLLELRSRYLAALSEGNVVRAAIANSEQEFRRLQLLNRDNHNVSDRAVAAAEALWNSDAARLAAAQTAASSLRDSMSQQWGGTLTEWATQPAAGPALQRLLQHEEVLLQASLPFGITPSKQTPLLITPTVGLGKMIPTCFVSSSPQTDTALQGKTYYYTAPAVNLRVGMLLKVQLAERGASTAGVIVPQNAVVWYANQAWIYRKLAVDKFVRQPIGTEIELGDGWFNATGIKAGDEIITRGAQLLLSEEFKFQIKNENEN